MHKIFTRSALGLSILMLAACGGGGGDTASTGTGTVSIAVQDAPVDNADAVWISFSQIDLHGPDGTQSHTLDSDPNTEGNQPYTVNLMDFQGSLSQPLLQDVTVTAGSYQWMRLYVEEDAPEVLDADLEKTYIAIDGAKHRLSIPSNAQTGLKLNRGFTVTDGGESDFTIEFDLRKSVHLDANGYKLRPTLRIVDNLEGGHISGTVAETTTAACAVYVYEGTGTTPDDMCYDQNGGDCADPHGVNPITSATVDCTSGTCLYETAKLAAGEYTLALNCSADLDTPDADEDLGEATWPVQSVTVNAGETTTVDF